MTDERNSEPNAQISPKPPRLVRLLRLVMESLRSGFSRLLQVEDEHKPKIYQMVFQGAEVADLNYWLELVFSMGIATLGLITNSAAVVIGAMLISPLMGPIIASGLAVALGDFYLGFKAFLNLVLSVLAAVLLSAVITWALPFHTPTPEILARVRPTSLDLGIAVLSGMAGSIVVCRGGRGGGITALPGVAIAVALMPPICVLGFGVGIGWDGEIIRGAGLLFLTNLVAIVFSAFLVFFSVRMDAAQVREQINEWLEQQERRERFFEAIQHTPLRGLLGRVGTLPRRVALLALFLVMVALPLQRTLLDLRDQTRIQRAALDEINRRIPRESIFQQELQVAAEQVSVRVVAVLPGGFPESERIRLEQAIAARAGRPAKVAVFDVATREAVERMGALARPGEQRVESIEELRLRLWSRAEAAIRAAWPSSAAPLLDYLVATSSSRSALAVHITYLSATEPGELGEEAVRQTIRERLGAPAARVTFERVAPSLQIAFARGSDALSREAARDLQLLGETLQRFSSLRLRVSVPAATDGKLAPLNERRVQRVRAFFNNEMKIDAARIETALAEVRPNFLLLELLPPSSGP
jgi:uncharacterized hydrophobic protein (TIGR00271 family)